MDNDGEKGEDKKEQDEEWMNEVCFYLIYISFLLKMLLFYLVYCLTVDFSNPLIFHSYIPNTA